MSHIVHLTPRANANTRFVPSGPRVETFWLDEAYLRARSLKAPLPPHPGVRFVWCRGSEIGWLDLPLQRGAFAVVGRHARCDVVLPFDAAIALRHLLVRPAVLEDGSIVTRFLDLKSGLGFHLDGDDEARSLVASGPLAIRVGRYAFVTLPTGVPLPDTRPETEVVDAPSLSLRCSWRTTTRFTLLPNAPMLEDIVRDRAFQGSARVTLRRGAHWARADFSEAVLDAGVFIGRAERCESELRRVMTPNLSRTHLLLLREQGTVQAFDLASTQGVYVDGQRVRRVRLPNSGATVQLGKVEPVALEWHPR